MFPPKAPAAPTMPFARTPMPNPVADAMNKKKKKYNLPKPGSSLTGLRKAAMGPGAMPGGITSPGGFSGG